MVVITEKTAAMENNFIKFGEQLIEIYNLVKNQMDTDADVPFIFGFIDVRFKPFLNCC